MEQGRRAGVERVSSRGPHDLLAGITPGGMGAAPVPGTRAREGIYAESPWVFALCDRVASSFAAVQWKVFSTRRPGERATRSLDIERASHAERQKLLTERRAAGELHEHAGHPLLQALNNGQHTAYELRKLCCLGRDLSGDTFLLKERNAMGTPISLYPIPSSWILSLPSPGAPFYRVSYRGWQGEIPATEFLRFSNPNPADPYGRGTGIIGALSDEIETDEMAAKMARQTFFNQARPDFLVFPKEGDNRPAWGEPERARLAEQWRAEHQGFWRVAKPKFLSREVGVFEFHEQNFRNLQLVQLREFERDVIRQTFGVPAEIIGDVANSNRATVVEARRLFAEFCLVPRLEAFRGVLQEFFAPDFDERILVDYVSPLPDDLELALQAATAAPWSLTRNEWRRLTGHGPLEGPEGTELLVPFNLTPRELGALHDISTRDLAALRSALRKAV